MRTEQEKFWSGSFGDDYCDRNSGPDLHAANLSFFSEVVNNTCDLRSVIEFGCNIGMNLKALNQVLPNAKISGVEINEKAAKIASETCNAEVINDSLLEVNLAEKYMMTFTKGVLIHINPDELNLVYEKLYEASERYVLVAEYYNPVPVTIPYRGKDDVLFKRDFAGEIMNKYPDLHLVNYGFLYRNDPNFPQDDISWFLMEKR